LQTFFEKFRSATSKSTEYLVVVDTASPQSGDLALQLPSIAPASQELSASPIPAELFEELWLTSQAEAVGLTQDEFSDRLRALGAKHNYNLRDGQVATVAGIASFLRALHLPDLALACACALGRDVAWERFLAHYRTPLTKAAIAIAGSALGDDLVDSLHSELFGLTERDGRRRSPLESYSGRGSLMGWLRTILAQRHVDHHRRTYRETSLESIDAEAPVSPATPSPAATNQLHQAIEVTLATLSQEERFLLSSYYLDQRSLHQIGQLLRVHEATVSRKLKRMTTEVRKRLLKTLQTAGLSKRAAEETLGIDPRDLSINLRDLLQTPTSPSFSQQADSTEQTS
jgi:RNA polymerase sigma-70 factor, ECF subfamily